MRMIVWIFASLVACSPVIGCETYVSPDGSSIQFIAADPHGPDQAFIAKLHDKNSEICVYTAEDETGGHTICSSGNRNEINLIDNDHLSFNAEPFHRDCTNAAGL